MVGGLRSRPFTTCWLQAGSFPGASELGGAPDRTVLPAGLGPGAGPGRVRNGGGSQRKLFLPGGWGPDHRPPGSLGGHKEPTQTLRHVEGRRALGRSGVTEAGAYSRVAVEDADRAGPRGH